MKTLVIALSVIGLVACAAPAQAPQEGDAERASAVAPMASGQAGPTLSASAAPTETAQPQESPEDVICRTERVTGSRFIRRVCHTRAEWKQMELAAAEAMRDIESQPRPIKQ